PSHGSCIEQTVGEGVGFFLFKQKTAYEIFTRLEFRRVLFRSYSPPLLSAAEESPGRPSSGGDSCQAHWRRRSRRSRGSACPKSRSEERRVGKECRPGWGRERSDGRERTRTARSTSGGETTCAC